MRFNCQKMLIHLALALLVVLTTFCKKDTKPGLGEGNGGENNIVTTVFDISQVLINNVIEPKIDNKNRTISFGEGNAAVLLSEDPNDDFKLNEGTTIAYAAENSENYNDVTEIKYLVSYQGESVGYTLTIKILDQAFEVASLNLDEGLNISESDINIVQKETGKGLITIHTDNTITDLNLTNESLVMKNISVDPNYDENDSKYSLSLRGETYVYEIQLINQSFIISEFKVGNISGSVENQSISITEGENGEVLDIKADDFLTYITFKNPNQNQTIENIKGFVDETPENDLNKANKITFEVVIGTDRLAYELLIDVNQEVLGLKKDHEISGDDVIYFTVKNNDVYVVVENETSQVKFNVINKNTSSKTENDKLILNLRGETKIYDYKQETYAVVKHAPLAIAKQSYFYEINGVPVLRKNKTEVWFDLKADQENVIVLFEDKDLTQAIFKTLDPATITDFKKVTVKTTTDNKYEVTVDFGTKQEIYNITTKLINQSFIISEFKVGNISGLVDNQTISITEGENGEVLDIKADDFLTYITFENQGKGRTIENIKGFLNETLETDLNRANKITFEVVIGTDRLAYELLIDVNQEVLGLTGKKVTGDEELIYGVLEDDHLHVVVEKDTTEVEFVVINENTNSEVKGDKLILDLRGAIKEYKYTREVYSVEKHAPLSIAKQSFFFEINGVPVLRKNKTEVWFDLKADQENVIVLFEDKDLTKEMFKTSELAKIDKFEQMVSKSTVEKQYKITVDFAKLKTVYTIRTINLVLGPTPTGFGTTVGFTVKNENGSGQVLANYKPNPENFVHTVKPQLNNYDLTQAWIKSYIYSSNGANALDNHPPFFNSPRYGKTPALIGGGYSSTGYGNIASGEKYLEKIDGNAVRIISKKQGALALTSPGIPGQFTNGQPVATALTDPETGFVTTDPAGNIGTDANKTIWPTSTKFEGRPNAMLIKFRYQPKGTSSELAEGAVFEVLLHKATTNDYYKDKTVRLPYKTMAEGYQAISDDAIGYGRLKVWGKWYEDNQTWYTVRVPIIYKNNTATPDYVLVNITSSDVVAVGFNKIGESILDLREIKFEYADPVVNPRKR